MLTVYPSNRLEVLAKLLEALLKESHSGVLMPETVLVESRGMQHWLSMQLAENMDVAMNLRFPMPTRFIWETARAVLGPEEVPANQQYKREVLAWRIDALLASGRLQDEGIDEGVIAYWEGATTKPDTLKRFQLASRLADLFEQYIMFRPHWLMAWENNEPVPELSELREESWQAWIWRELVRAEPAHPVKLQQKIIEALQTPVSGFPEQIFIFAINTLAPQTLDFFDAYAKHVEVHLFHLNPCVSFWGDQQSDKALAKQLRQQQLNKWIEPESEGVRNPLLANLGQQGKALFNLLQEREQFEVSAFVDPLSQAQESREQEPQEQEQKLLHQIQGDILHLEDPTDREEKPRRVDDSIVISSSHSALREIQALHDYLLHQFNGPENTLSPQDVLVMCPAIEDYAPYIDAVFRRPWEPPESDGCPRLPCSIADRTLLDSEPLVGAFIELLQLPDSRFELSNILDYLRIPAVQKKFDINDSELTMVEWWLKEAAIHWGLDPRHKASMAGLVSETGSFTWEWGLDRLLYGYAYSDHEAIKRDQLWLPHVEGQQAVALGRVMQLIEQLKLHATELKTERTPQEWQAYLLSMIEQVFTPGSEDKDTYELIEKVISGLSDFCAQARYEEVIDLSIVRFFLNQNFSQPDAGNHFMTGQITFCSMVPMRSIPFKVIAVLGLNDGKFPRQNIPISFDLMSRTKPERGDRSRREDDRYLFLEGLISARQILYLSYQGRDIKNNSERQPSLILTEFMNYLEKGYGWKLQKDGMSDLVQTPLHPFSMNNFMAEQPSFDGAWKRLTTALEPRNNLIGITPAHSTNEPEPDLSQRTAKRISVNDIVRFLDDPLKQFAQTQLALYLDDWNERLEDSEPFAINNLMTYKLNDVFTETLSEGKDLFDVKTRFALSGELPDSPVAAIHLDHAEECATRLYQEVSEYGEATKETLSVPIESPVSVEKFVLEGEIYRLCDSTVLFYRPGKQRAKDLVQMWLCSLLATVDTGEPVAVRGIFLDAKEQKIDSKLFGGQLSVEDARSWLTTLIKYWILGEQTPLLLHAKLAEKVFKKREDFHVEELLFDPKMHADWTTGIEGGFNESGLHSNSYFSWFYPDTPEPDRTIITMFCELYQPMFQALVEAE